MPDTGQMPIAETSPAGHPGATAHLLGQHLPGDTRVEDEQDARQRGSIRQTRTPAFGFGRLGRKQRLNLGPERIGQQFSCHTRQLPTVRFC
jgi:hypothetical protein